MLRTLFFYLIMVPATGMFSLWAIVLPRMAGWVGKTWGGVTRCVSGASFDVDLSTLDPQKNYVFMVNHQSQLDIPFLNHILRAWPVGFVAKESLFKIPLFGRASIAAGHIPINRSNSRKAMKSIALAAEKVKAGRAVIIFPEGTRADDLSTLQPFKIGGMLIALKSGVPVAPLVVTGTGSILHKGQLRIHKGHVTVKALPPIDVSAYTLKDRERFMAELHEKMCTAYHAQLHGVGGPDAT